MAAGAHNWSPWSFSPRTGLVYFQASEAYMRYEVDPDWRFVPEAGYNLGQLRTPALAAEDAGRMPRGGGAYVLAWDPVEGAPRFRIEGRGGGVLATAGDLLFQSRGVADGELIAWDATNGERLWSHRMPNAAVAAPISYMLDGEQYIVIGTGLTYYGASDTESRMPQPGRLVAFKLGGSVTLPEPSPLAPPANPPDETFDDAAVQAGDALYLTHCARCHGNEARNSNVVPDLRRAPTLASRDAWRAVVIDGALTERGMIGWGHLIDDTQAESIRAYVAGQARRLQAVLAEDDQE
jgi:mono/diheme cytochrome c family protein